jgi:hypothetical protein
VPGYALVTFTPGAVTVTGVRVSEKLASEPSSATAPTERTPGYAAG